MKKQFLTILFAFSISLCFGQRFQVKDLAKSTGFWEGNLTYLDYSSGKPYSMAANITLSLTQDQKGFIMLYEYPKEPHANAKDTTYVKGNLFGKDQIVAFKKELNGDFQLITDVDGEDGNDHKKAVLRHTYLLKEPQFSIVKEVKFVGSDQWIKRNEYVFKRQAKDSNRLHRIAKIRVDAKQLEAYKLLLKEQMNTAIKVEPGVLSYTAVADKKDATSITIFEVYANVEAYQSHIQTPHFKKYKDAVKDMVFSLELIDTDVVCLAKKDNF
jgi:quinol monooxygenase YgiN